MLFRLLLVFIGVPIVELVLLFYLAQFIHPINTLLLVVATGFLGAVLARHQGWNTIVRIRQELASGQMPTESLMEGAMILVAGAVLLTPGILTDLCGFCLLVPPIRRRLRTWFIQWVRARFSITVATARPDHDVDRGDQVIDSYVIPETEQNTDGDSSP